MTREIVTAHIRPAGPADAESIAYVQNRSWQDTYEEKLPTFVIQRAAAVWGPGHWRNELNKVDNQKITLVLDTEDRGIVGFAHFGLQKNHIDHYQGELYAIYLLQEIQRQGAGGHLLQSMARIFQSRNINSALVWCLASNISARRFYISMGADPIGPRLTRLFGEDVAEAGYGWRDLTALTKRSVSRI